MKSFLHKGFVVLLAGMITAATSCMYDGAMPHMAATRYGGTTMLRPETDTVSYWDGDGMTGSPSVRINLSEQRAYFYKGGKLAGVSAISSGREGLNTVTGHFHIIEKDKHHMSSLYGDYVDAHGNVIQKEIDSSKDPKPPGARFDGARMPNFMRITGATGMHEGYLPGYAASHGCIRMPGAMAARFYNSVSVGTPVTIEE